MCLWDYDCTSTVLSHWQIQCDKNDYMLNSLVTPLNTHTHARTHTHTHSRQETEQTHSSPSSIKLKERIRILLKSFNLLSQNSNLYWNSKSDDGDFLKRFQNKKQDFSEWHILKWFFFSPLKDNPNQTYPTTNTQSLMKEVYVN